MSQLLDAFEEGIEQLRIAYEKYFLGVERQAPAIKHQRVKAQMRQIEQQRPRSTVLRFRFSGLKARLVTYQHYWNRILGQIEKGTYRRDLQQRVERRKQAASDPVPCASASPATAERAAPPRPPPPPVPGMKGAEVDRLFRELVRAKQAAGEDVQGLTVRALARKLSRELPRLRQRHGDEVRFEVATVGGKVRLRARSASDAR
ncbi:MAG: MXAN_5187 C-terminal domain-containing protein [Myxococcota bacterium]